MNAEQPKLSPQSIRLIKEKFTMMAVLPSDLFEFEVIKAEQGELVGKMFARIWVNETIGEIRYPADWWESFKLRWLPQFLQRRFPVRYTEWTARQCFTHFTPPESWGPQAYFISPYITEDDERR